MKNKFYISFFILLCWLLIIIFRFEAVSKSLYLLYETLLGIFTNFRSTIAIIDPSMADLLIGVVFILILPFLLICIYSKKYQFIHKKLSFTSSVIIVLMFFLITAPIISNVNPDFQKNLRMTKLLPPFSSVNVLHLQKKIKNSSGGKLKELKENVVKSSFDESIVFFDSLKIGNEIFIYQKGIAKSYKLADCILVDNYPYVTSRFFLLGTDHFGRDTFSRLVYGARVSIFIGLGAVIISLLIGFSLGFLAGNFGGLVDSLFSRITDMFLTFPIIFLIVLIIALFGSNMFSIIIVLGFSGWMSLFKVVKGEVVSLKNKDYFLTARLLGLSKFQLMTREVFPVVVTPVLVNVIFLFGNVILAESALSYLGLGIGNSFPSWGAMIQSGQEYYSKAWWMLLFPGLCLIVTLFTANNFGRKLRAYINPGLYND